ncbi:dipeptidase AC [Roseibium hamelinense]|uniref:Dipeptidase AC n=1 Tax=Roseibium hamelinense TaxID=150831 RepID=A0A562SU17_9HYPH|nr:dipeptidase [Roseibium hamelinense]TWI84781.1 dipeptidase AC [Roseibium hamelinense]
MAENNRPVPVFDGHNDVLLKLELESRTVGERDFLTRSQRGHMDLPRCQEGGFAGGLFAMFVPSNPGNDFSKPFDPRDPANYAPVPQEEALGFTMRLLRRAFQIERRSLGEVAICRTVDEIEAAMASQRLAISLHIEGAEAIDTNFDALETLYAAGLRSLGPVWSRPNDFAEGVPMTFPASSDTGPGLTDAGKALVKACNELKILVDLSHLNERGFWDVAEITDAPLVASHSNAHALCENARNLTDKQLDAIRETDGLVGLNFHTAFLRADGGFSRDTPLIRIAAHAAYLIERLGVDKVALGSDFDGCMPPADLPSVAALPRLIETFRSHGFDEDTIQKLAYKNWLRVLRLTQS